MTPLSPSSSRVRQLGQHDVYLIEVPAVMGGRQLERLADAIGHPRPIYPPQLLHDVLRNASFALNTDALREALR